MKLVGRTSYFVYEVCGFCLFGLFFLYQFRALRVRQTLHRTVKNKVPWMMYFFANSVKSYARLVIFFQPKIY